MNSRSIFGTNQKVMEEELERKAEEYRNKVEITMISQQCERAKVRYELQPLFVTKWRLPAICFR